MIRRIAVVCAVVCLVGCSAPKGRINKVGTITISGYEFSDCNKAGAAIEVQTNNQILLCGYSVEELMRVNGANFDHLFFVDDGTHEEAESLTDATDAENEDEE